MSTVKETLRKLIQSPSPEDRALARRVIQKALAAKSAKRRQARDGSLTQ
ncbi:MAG TPA: hypothetical protein VFZ04_11770 [Longimicrobiales bacterium]